MKAMAAFNEGELAASEIPQKERIMELAVLIENESEENKGIDDSSSDTDSKFKKKKTKRKKKRSSSSSSFKSRESFSMISGI